MTGRDRDVVEENRAVEGARAVEGRSLTKRYGSTVAVEGLDLVVGSGAVHGLVGPNGAGKSTVLGILLGLVQPDEGTLCVLGRNRAEAKEGWLDGIGGFIETPRFYPYLSARQNLEHLARMDGEQGTSPVDSVLDSVGLSADADRKVKGYSLGMRQRLGLGAALLRSPRLLILDEPANGLDPAGMRDLRAMLREMSESGTAVLLSSHDMAAVEDVCDSVTVLRAGRSVFDGTVVAMRREAPEAAYRLHTSDDRAAIACAQVAVGVEAEWVGAERLRVRAPRNELDALVIELGRAGVAVRSLTLEVSALESLFFQLTEGTERHEEPRRRRFDAAPIGGRRWR